MRRSDISYEIRERMINCYELEGCSSEWETCYEGIPVEILGCKTLHYNGTNKSGLPLLTQGRFGINKNMHQKLEDERGLYLFVLYRLINNKIILINDRLVPVRYVSPLLGKGRVTKIGWAKIFHLPTRKR